MKPVQVIVAHNHGGIGFQQTIPWKLQHDMNLFKHLTLYKKNNSSAVIMGRKTYESMNSEPLCDRLNIVISTTISIANKNTIVFQSLQHALDYCETNVFVQKIWIIGGSRLYHEAFLHPQTVAIYMTSICSPTFDCDAFIKMPDRKTWSNIETTGVYQEKGILYQFSRWTRGSGFDYSKSLRDIVTNLRHDEYEYLNLLHNVLETCDLANPRQDRTLVGTYSTFGHQCRYNLRKCFPLFTTKRTFWKAIVCELLWMISGSTDSKVLENQGVTIWKGNGSREFLDQNGFQDRKVGDLGPIYGFQWRHSGAKYMSSGDDYDKKGVDQLKRVIEQIKHNPTSRRIVLSAWNVADLSSMALPPCHILCQFYVNVEKKELSCHLYQRSCDLGLGVPFNVASYSLLTHMIAHLTGLNVGDFIHSMGDAHIYSNHVDGLREQLKRKVRNGPQLKIVRNNIGSIDEFRAKDFELVNYRPHPKIVMEMAV